MTIVELVDTINALPDAIRSIPLVFDFIEAVVSHLDTSTPDDVMDFVLYEDGSVEIVD